MAKLMLPLALPLPDPASRERALPERLDMPKPVERSRPELPLLKMNDRTFVLTGMADCQWTAQLAKDKRVIQCTTTCLTQMSFTRRTFALQEDHPRSLSSNSFSKDGNAFEDFTTTVTPARFSLVEVMLSRALELEAYVRSDSSPWSTECWLKNSYMEEVFQGPACGCDRSQSATRRERTRSTTTDSPSSCTSSADTKRSQPIRENLPRRVACTVRPATVGKEPYPDKINVYLLKATPGEVNELRWLLGSIVDVQGATLFTQLIERGDARPDIHIVLEPQSPTGLGKKNSKQTHHCFKFTEPWRAAWKWICLIPGESPQSAAAAYLAAVASTWAPVPECVDSSWLYTLGVSALPRADPRSDAPRITLDPRAGNLFPDTLAAMNRQKGFTSFLWDVVAFWRGIYRPHDEHDISWMPSNDDLSAHAALTLKNNLSAFTNAQWMIGVIPLGLAVKSAWKNIGWKHCWIPNAENDFVLNIPNKLRSVDFMLYASVPDSHKLKEDILLNGYKLITANESAEEGSFRLGISSAGLFCAAPFLFADIADRNGRQRQRWLFDIGEGFTLESTGIGFLFIATHGSNVQAHLDEKYARYWGGLCPMGAVADWPRCCYMSRYMAQQQRLEFSMLDEGDVRSLGLLRLLKALSDQGGLLHINCDNAQTFLTPSLSAEDTILRMTVPRNRQQQRARHVKSSLVGRVCMECVTPGRYNVTKLPDHPKSSADALKCNFCQVLLSHSEEIEVYKADQIESDGIVGAWDVDVIQIQPGLAVSLRSLADLTTHGNRDVEASDPGGALPDCVWVDGTGHILLDK